MAAYGTCYTCKHSEILASPLHHNNGKFECPIYGYCDKDKSGLKYPIYVPRAKCNAYNKQDGKMKPSPKASEEQIDWSQAMGVE